MTYKDVELHITELLEANANLRHWWTHPPSLMHFPFMGNRQHHFLLISISVKAELMDREKQVEHGLAVAQIALASGLLTDEKGVEVPVWLIEPRRRRIFRLSIHEAAYAQAKKLSASDLLSKQYDGIKCSWPLVET